MNVRLLDLNDVSYLHSQTIYHAVAYCTTEESPGTIIFLTPGEPYVSVGYHQVMEKEIETEYCREKGIPTIRREVGGGAVYLDKDQLFFQCVFPSDMAPRKVDRLYEHFLQPAVEAYCSLGIDAYYRPVNDIQVEERKICGTGAGSIGDASVVVGNIMFDFNYEAMARVLRVPSKPYRDKVFESMTLYVTSLHKELGTLPDREEVKETLIKKFEDRLGISLIRGELTDGEQRTLADIDQKFTDPNWVNQEVGKFDNWVKITTDVRVMETAYDSPEGRIGVILRLKNDIIDDLSISGNFTSEFQSELDQLHGNLTGKPRNEELLLTAIEAFFNDRGLRSPGLSPEDIVKAICADAKR